jgi:peptidoglycan/xylan/chitin deacetylase (PgdA/CDA1 family)
MMRLPGRKSLRRVMRPVERMLFPGAIVLGYHRIADASWDPLQLQVQSVNFIQQLEVLRELREVIGLAELVQRHAKGERLDKYAVLTFDDGYADFADTVVPIARRFSAPVTVFVTSGSTGHSFWWEELAALLGHCGEGKSSLSLSLGASEVMTFSQLGQAEARVEAVNAIAARLSATDQGVIDSVLVQLRSWAGPAQLPPPVGSPISAEALTRVAQVPLVEIGAHTVSHCFLERLTPAEQRREIAQSKRDLERLCGRPISVFSYPNGSYSSETIKILRELGFSCACASRDGSFSPRTDPYMIPRIWAPDLPRAEFRSWLGGWISGAGVVKRN